MTIIAALWATVDVTVKIREMISGNQLFIDTENLTKYLGDPAPGLVKSISILYYYSDTPADIRLWARKEHEPPFTISRGSDGVAIAQYPQPESQGIRLFGAVYADYIIKQPIVLLPMTNAMDGAPYPVTDDTMGGDPWEGHKKTLHLYYGPGPKNFGAFDTSSVKSKGIWQDDNITF